MAEPNEHINQYSAVDIERYYSGKMSAHEMHQLEKAALDDPFLADALEGYQYSAHPGDDSLELQKNLGSKLSGGKVVPLEKRTEMKRLLRIAALFIFIAGSAWIIYQFGLTTTDKNIAVTTNAAQEQKSLADTLSNPDTQGIEAAPVEEKAEDVTQVQEQSQPANARKTAISVVPEKKGTATTASAPEATNNKTERNDNSRNFLKEESTELNQVTVSASAPSDTTNVPVAASGNGTQRNITANSENVIVMRRAKDTNVQTIVLGKSRGDSVARGRSTITFEDVEPEKGEVYYDDYVIQNLNIPEELKIKNTSGEVQLSFEVNDLGDAVNIKVEKSLCADCDKEAIRLLQEGPKWSKKKNKKGKVRIRF